MHHGINADALLYNRATRMHRQARFEAFTGWHATLHTQKIMISGQQARRQYNLLPSQWWINRRGGSHVKPGRNFHTSRKASPMFLFAAPSCRCTSECTISAMVLTKLMTPSCSTSVRSVKFRMSQKPNIATCTRHLRLIRLSQCR